MFTAVKTSDLCDTCNDLNICLSDHRRPVIFCEQFDNFVPETNRKPSPAVETEKHRNNTNSDGKLLGLCINCDFRAECPFAKKQGGVWHCEEYR